MNMLTQPSSNTSQVTMSSPELVDYINVHRQAVATIEKPYKELRHDHFMAKVPQVLGEKAAPIFLGTNVYTNGTGGMVQRQIYIFPKREACLMAMSYSYELQAQVFDRMTAMEDALKAQKPKELSRMDLIQLALAAEQENIALKQHVAVLEPKAKALETIANTEGTYTVRECAKTIGIGERKLVQLLLDKKWVFRESDGRLQPYAEKRAAGIFINRPSPVIVNKNTGEERVHLHMRVTAFGLTRITGLVNKTQGAAA